MFRSKLFFVFAFIAITSLSLDVHAGRKKFLACLQYLTSTVKNIRTTEFSDAFAQLASIAERAPMRFRALETTPDAGVTKYIYDRMKSKAGPRGYRASFVRKYSSRVRPAAHQITDPAQNPDQYVLQLRHFIHGGRYNESYARASLTLRFVGYTSEIRPAGVRSAVEYAVRTDMNGLHGMLIAEVKHEHVNGRFRNKSMTLYFVPDEEENKTYGGSPIE